MNPYITEGQLKLYNHILVCHQVTNDPKYIAMNKAVLNLQYTDQVVIDNLYEMVELMRVANMPDVNQFIAVIQQMRLNDVEQDNNPDTGQGSISNSERSGSTFL